MLDDKRGREVESCETRKAGRSVDISGVTPISRRML